MVQSTVAILCHPDQIIKKQLVIFSLTEKAIIGQNSQGKNFHSREGRKLDPILDEKDIYHRCRTHIWGTGSPDDQLGQSTEYGYLCCLFPA